MQLHIKYSSTTNYQLQLPKHGDNGIDLPAAHAAIIPAKQLVSIDTGIAIQISPNNAFALVLGRSGLAFNHQIIAIHTGLIDANYRGNIRVLLFNAGLFDYYVEKHERIAQLLVMQQAYFQEVVQVENLTQTTRGTNGFGSTGKL